jgi:hypothetical protein
MSLSPRCAQVTWDALPQHSFRCRPPCSHQMCSQGCPTNSASVPQRVRDHTERRPRINKSLETNQQAIQAHKPNSGKRTPRPNRHVLIRHGDRHLRNHWFSGVSRFPLGARPIFSQPLSAAGPGADRRCHRWEAVRDCDRSVGLLL